MRDPEHSIVLLPRCYLTKGYQKRLQLIHRRLQTQPSQKIVVPIFGGQHQTDYINSSCHHSKLAKYYSLSLSLCAHACIRVTFKRCKKLHTHTCICMCIEISMYLLFIFQSTYIVEERIISISHVSISISESYLNPIPTHQSDLIIIYQSSPIYINK